MYLQLNILENRTTPSYVYSADGIVHIGEKRTDTISVQFQPFPGYTGPLDTEHVAGMAVVVGSEVSPRVQVRLAGANFNYDRVVFDDFVFPEMNAGVKVAIDGDNIIVGSMVGPRVRTYHLNENKLELVSDGYAFDPIVFKGGVDVEGPATFPDKSAGPVFRIDGVTRLAGADPTIRGITDWAYLGDRVALITGTSLATFDLEGHQLTAATTFSPYTRIGQGSVGVLDNNALVASDFEEIDDVDPNFGQDYFWDDRLSNIIGGSSYEPEPQKHYNVGSPFSYALSARDSQTLSPGVSIGSPETGTGTFTLPVIDKTDGQIVGLTNHHVSGEVGSTITQPGQADSKDLRPIGVTKRVSILDGHVDAGLFTIASGEEVRKNQLELNFYNHRLHQYDTRYIDYVGVSEFTVGSVVYKTGRTSGTTLGYVQSTTYAPIVQYHDDSLVKYTNQVSIGGFASPFALPGDSGSVVFYYENGKAKIAGQLFAGGSFNGIVTPIQTVLDTMNVRLINGT